MSKKHQPQKGDHSKNRIQTVLDQQNEPYLRALQKRVRNLNKKLTEIADLEGKPNLKPEQIDKINRKPAVVEEIAKIEENATFFREIYVENVQHYRNQQLKELDNLAKGIAIYHSGNALEQKKLANLWKALDKSDKTYPTLNDAVEDISKTLKDFANDKKVQKAIDAHLEQNGKAEFKPVQAIQEKLVNEILVQKEEKKEEPKVDAPPPPPQLQPVAQPAPVVAETRPEPVASKPEPQVLVEKESTPIHQDPVPEAPKEERKAENKGDDKKDEGKPERKRENRDRPYKPRGDYKPRDNRDNRREGDNKRKFKPKYEEKNEPRPQTTNQGDDSSSDSEIEARQFRKEEIKKLEDEGFIVVGKPKPKPKDNREVRDFHDRQHGKKHHHHGKPQNY